MNTPASKDVWTKVCTVGHTVTLYSFHKIIGGGAIRAEVQKEGEMSGTGGYDVKLTKNQ